MKFTVSTLLVAMAAICQANVITDSKFLSNGILGENVIMEPLPDKTGEAACLIFIIGAYCDQKAYMDHLKAI